MNIFLFAVLGLASSLEGVPPPLPSDGVRLYLGEKQEDIPNYSMVAGRDFFEESIGGYNSGLWCQNSNATANETVGNWTYPNGSIVHAVDNSATIHMDTAPGQVALLRDGEIGAQGKGMYTCTISDGGGSHILVVWAAGNNDYDDSPNPNTENLTLHLLAQSRYADPPEFALNFKVCGSPPTYIDCYIDGHPVDVATLTREVLVANYDPTPETNITVTLRTRQAGDYHCSVSVFRASGSKLNDSQTPLLSITVAGTPTYPKSELIEGSNTNVKLSWTAPTKNSPSITGYEVFFKLSGTDSVQSGSNTSDTTVILKGLELWSVCELFVIAYSDKANALPSDKQVFELVIPELIGPLNTTISADSIHVSWNSAQHPPVHYVLLVDCILVADSSVSDQMAFSLPMTDKAFNITDIVSGTECNISLYAQYCLAKSNTLTTMVTISSQSSGISAGAIAGIVISILVATPIMIFLGTLLLLKMSPGLNSWCGERLPFVGKAYLRPWQGETTHIYHFDRTQSTRKSPVIEEFPCTMMVVEGQMAKLKVKVCGIPAPSFRWYSGDKVILAGSKYVVEEDGSLVISSVDKQDSGSYKLVAANVAGSVHQETKLVVMRNESRPAEKVPYIGSHMYTAINKKNTSLKPVSLDEFGTFVATNHNDDNEGFYNLFSRCIDQMETKSATVALNHKNKKLNRYTNIVTYDDNRVVLEPLGIHPECQTDYINAGYVNVNGCSTLYISTQGPKQNTMIDFWRMVWQEDIQTVVMVTNIKERNKTKCEQYWPETGERKFGPFCITLIKEKKRADYSIRKLQIGLENADQHFEVTQFQFTAWLESQIPSNAAPFLEFRHVVKEFYDPKTHGPMLVHCSSGVGRSGVFIAVDILLDRIGVEKEVDVVGTVLQMHSQRMKMIQTLEQFIFIFDIILESLSSRNTQISLSNLTAEISALLQVEPTTGMSGFQKEFQALNQESLDPEKVKHDVTLQFASKNRSLFYPPPDSHRVLLKGEYPDYIHASFVNSYRKKKAFIIAQSPIKETCRDFWKMVTDWKCASIVMLCGTIENGQEVCAQYWPKDRVVTIGEFIVELQQEDSFNRCKRRKLLVHHTSGAVHTVTQYQIETWDPSGICDDLQMVISVKEEVSREQTNTGNNPVVVHCSDTVGRSGTFCAIATVIEQCKTESMVDIFQTVKRQRFQKPGSVSSALQYKMIFDVLANFVENLEEYDIMESVAIP